MAYSKKAHFSKLPILKKFSRKFLRWIEWCEGHLCSSMYMAVRLSEKSSKTAKKYQKCIFGLNHTLATMTLWPETLWLGHFGQRHFGWDTLARMTLWLEWPLDTGQWPFGQTHHDRRDILASDSLAGSKIFLKNFVWRLLIAFCR